MTTQEIILDIGQKAEQIRQSSESFLNAPARDAAIQITALSGRLQIMNSTAIQALLSIAKADTGASADDMRLRAKAVLSSLNEQFN